MSYFLHCLFSLAPDRCCNCRRKQVGDEVDSFYKLQLNLEVSSTIIKKASAGACRFLSRTNANKEIKHTLCDECFEVCVNDSKEFKDRWPAFLWKLLSQSIHSPIFGHRYLHQIYEDQLWKIIPETMRPWWIDSVRAIFTLGITRFETLHSMILHHISLIKPWSLSSTAKQCNLTSLVVSWRGSKMRTLTCQTFFVHFNAQSRPLTVVMPSGTLSFNML